MKKFTRRAILALDLDGTIRTPKSGKKFNENPEDFTLLPNVEEKLTEYKDHKGYIIVGVSNQGGVAHGFKNEQAVISEMNFTKSLFKDENMFTMIKWSYNDPKGVNPPYNSRSLFRKPYYGLLAVIEYELISNHSIIPDWDRSLMVGDMESDRACAKAADLRFAWAHEFFGFPKEEK